jgi:WD40 repeat protein
VSSVAFGPNGIIATGSNDHTVRLWSPGATDPLSSLSLSLFSFSSLSLSAYSLPLISLSSSVSDTFSLLLGGSTMVPLLSTNCERNAVNSTVSCVSLPTVPSSLFRYEANCPLYIVHDCWLSDGHTIQAHSTQYTVHRTHTYTHTYTHTHARIFKNTANHTHKIYLHTYTHHTNTQHHTKQHTENLLLAFFLSSEAVFEWKEKFWQVSSGVCVCVCLCLCVCVCVCVCVWALYVLWSLWVYCMLCGRAYEQKCGGDKKVEEQRRGLLHSI